MDKSNKLRSSALHMKLFGEIARLYSILIRPVSMAAVRRFGSPVFVFLAFTVLFCHLIFSDLHQQLTKITARSFTENQTPPSSCSERKVIIQLGSLIRISLAKHGFRRFRVGFSKWSKHGQTTLVVAGHDPPIDITIYSDIAFESWSTISE